ncbi:MAG: TIGR04086 family membrane protein [bacterium]
MIEEKDHKTVNNKIIFKGVFLGFVFLFIITLILAIISGIIHTINSSFLHNIMVLINFIILLLVGFYIARNVESNGWLNGGLGGLIYMGLILLIGIYFVSLSGFNIFLLLITGMFIGSIGGIIGINL